MQDFMKMCEANNPGEPEFLQAVSEVVESVEPVLEKHPEYRSAKILERMIEPERVIMFRVPWVDDRGEVQINRGLQDSGKQRDRSLQGWLRSTLQST